MLQDILQKLKASEQAYDRWLAQRLLREINTGAPALVTDSTRGIQLYAKCTAIALLMFSSVVTLGWLLDIEWLTAPAFGIVTMKVNTALSFAMICAYMLMHDSSSRNVRIFARAAAALAFMLGTLVGVEYIFDTNLGIDQLLARDPDSLCVKPGRMAPLTALSMSLAGLGCLLDNFIRADHYKPSEVAGIVLCLVGLLTTIGYAYGVPALYDANILGGLHTFTQLAFSTGVSLLLLGLALLLGRNDNGLTFVFNRSTRGGMLLRTLAPGMVALPILFGFVKRYMEQLGLISPELGITVLILAIIVVGLALVYAAALRLDAADARRVRNEQQRQDLIYSVAHDLKMPLLGATQMLNLIVDGGVQDVEAVRKYLKVMADSNNSALRTIENLMYEFEREKRTELSAGPIDVAKLVNECVAEIKPLADSKNLNITTDLHDQGVSLMADRALLKRALVDLLHNAVKFTNEGSIEIGTTVRNHTLHLSVADTGCGIAKEQQDKLFQRTWQDETSMHGGGPGLGLYLAKQIVDDHHGTITCSSARGHGATFTIGLPYHAPSQACSSWFENVFLQEQAKSQREKDHTAKV